MDHYHKKYLSEMISEHSVSEKVIGTVGWRCPSNIALVKYWGKSDNQIPKNPSISFTLKNAFSTTVIDYETGRNTSSVEFYLEKKREIKFENRIKKYLDDVSRYLPFIKYTQLIIRSENSFPHSSGIASSASGLGAIALCLCSVEERLKGTVAETTDFYKKASFLARLGSGSACRSVYADAALWGFHEDINSSSDELAIPYGQFLHKEFKGFKDFILIIDRKEKSVSSSLGHHLMNGHPYSESRFKVAHKNILDLDGILRSGDLESFIKLIEHEALTLHAMMLTSDPGYLLMKPNTIEAIQKIMQFRDETKSLLAYTMDAGANIHLLCHADSAKIVEQFLEEELKTLFCEGSYIADELGEGPVKLENL